MAEELPAIRAILEKQARLSELRRRLAEEGGEAARQTLAHLHLAEGPWLTVSKQLGCGGLELAQRLSKELGWQVFDREIVSAIARHTHTREQVLADLDQRATRPLDEYIAHLFGPAKPGSASFTIETVRVIWGIARRGNAIIVGRGANIFLDPRYGLRVRLVAPLEQRVAYVARQEGIDSDEATRRVREDDRGQVEFIRKTFKADINDPARYDLVINTGALPQAALDAICLGALRSKLGT